MKKYKAAILGYYGFGNLGDELLLSACLEMFSRCGVSRDSLVILSNTPEETSRNYGVDSVNRWSFRESVKAFRNSETLLLGGGGIFQDTSSVKSCVWYWGMVRLARLCGCRVWALGQSVGPLKSTVSTVLAGNALRSCKVLHVRDEKSYMLAESLGCKNLVRGCDLVMTLKPEVSYSHKYGYMLVNLRPCEKLDSFVKVIAPHLKDTRVVGAALSDDDVDALGVLGLSEIVRVKSWDGAEELLSGAVGAVGMRLHFGVLARIFRIPLALMPYDAKVSGFAEQSGVPCIVDEWREPVMPLAVPECAGEINTLCREILAL
ncbi:MAG: polysaccharide pyruvyl transferase family protein [Synergistaceae bacterium]|nr:polysaccharide pyruvyl transferase family protein [Synergistaceae bacterium]